MQTIFTSKANVLRFLSQSLKKSAVENMYDFTVSQWSDNRTEILKHIRSLFNRKRVIVRSSAIGEDSIEKSDAGNYESVLNVPSFSEKRLRNAIDSVITSYLKKSNLNRSNQILVQKQTENVVTSGVLFTRTETIGAPYYTINYEDGPSTENVTKGKINNTIKIFRNIVPTKIPHKWRLLLESVKEIESTVGSDLLDIEFAITSFNNVVVFQVRPLTSAKIKHVANLDANVKKSIVDNQRKFSRLNRPHSMFGSYTIFSDMADWNPAEIIGNNPNLLDYSLYNYLIMTSSWHKARTKLGYHDGKPHGLMVRFGNKPYVDTRASFNSLVADTIPNGIKNKLVNSFLDKLTQNPQLHDKVEFEILFTCYDLTLDTRLRELLNLTEAERDVVSSRLLDFTNKLIKQFPEMSRRCERNAANLVKSREAIRSQLEHQNRNYHVLLAAVERLLRDCIRWGTIPFSMMARMAFISYILLKSLATRENLAPHVVDAIMKSVRTPLSEFQDDFMALCDGTLAEKDFFNKYGHLRPGTYDITAPRYDQRKDLFADIQFSRPKVSAGGVDGKMPESLSLTRYSLQCEVDEFLDFARNSLRLREELKFLFTKHLSDALELIGEAGLTLGFSPNEMAHMSIDTIIKSYKRLSEVELKASWRRQIEKEKQRQLINDHLVLPPIIKSADDFEIITYFQALPNFITSKTIVEETVYLASGKEVPDLTGRIILLENADPGYDWIFTRNPAGLITKYGGVASHMSIRCAEIGLPAAIGCGEILFQKLLSSEKVLLDCANQQIITLEEQEPDSYMEEKRVLKWLGYIK